MATEIEGETDEAFIRRVQAFADSIGNLYDKMDRQSLEDSFYAAGAEGILLGIRGRISQANKIRARARRAFRERNVR